MRTFTERQIIIVANRVINNGRYMAAMGRISVEESTGYESAMSKLRSELGIANEYVKKAPPAEARENQ